MNKIKSPCINKCVTGKDNICQGCYRIIEEIKTWETAPEHIKKAILRMAFHRKFR